MLLLNEILHFLINLYDLYTKWKLAVIKKDNFIHVSPISEDSFHLPIKEDILTSMFCSINS